MSSVVRVKQRPYSGTPSVRRSGLAPRDNQYVTAKSYKRQSHRGGDAVFALAAKCETDAARRMCEAFAFFNQPRKLGGYPGFRSLGGWTHTSNIRPERSAEALKKLTPQTMLEANNAS